MLVDNAVIDLTACWNHFHSYHFGFFRRPLCSLTDILTSYDSFLNQ